MFIFETYITLPILGYTNQLFFNSFDYKNGFIIQQSIIYLV